MYRFAFALAFAALILLLTMPVKAEEEAQDGKLRLIVSTTQIYDFVRQVVGDRCEVECILEAGANPHSYNPTPGDARKVIASDICFQNGLHLEGSNWMATLAKDAGKPIITCTDGIETLELEYGGKKVSDPHAWFSPKHAAVYVNNVTREMIRFDPDGEQEYKLRASLYLQQLRALDSWIRKTMNSLPVQKRILVTSHGRRQLLMPSTGSRTRLR
ncbi:MAG: zinc ABC transporter substrate-binding protein [Planctomycetota bacterium]|nr:zinc ABC transporter substrate-binding protein [Planctomycetota bacterium]